jgi:hypothetical protein
MPRYYRTFLATGLLTAMTLPAMAQTSTPDTVSPAHTATTPPVDAPKAVTHHVQHHHRVVAAKKVDASQDGPK